MGFPFFACVKSRVLYFIKNNALISHCFLGCYLLNRSEIRYAHTLITSDVVRSYVPSPNVMRYALKWIKSCLGQFFLRYKHFPAIWRVFLGLFVLLGRECAITHL